MSESQNKGIMRWVTTTNHKDIGTLYLLASLAAFVVAGGMALVIRAELSQPGMVFINPIVYNQMLTMHGLIMIFGAVMPAWAGFANWMIPLMIGAPDMAFPRMNNFSFWLLPVGFILLFMGMPSFGWTAYAPLSVMDPYNSTEYFVFAVHVLGISSILASINIIVTIMRLRTPGMSYMKMPMFVWSWLITSYLLIAILPVLAVTVTMLLADRQFGTGFFNAGHGGDPLMYQHLFWFFGHPEVYVLILPAFGVISHVIPAFSRKPLFGYSCMVYAIASIAVVGMMVWAHHMFTSGMIPTAKIFFMVATLIVAVPTGVKVFNWLATMYRGVISFEPPMLFAIAFVLLFTFGGLSGVMQAIVSSDIQYHDSYFIVAHFHYVLVTGTYFSICSGVYYWLPKWTGRMYSHRLANWHFWLSVVFANVTFLPMHFLGLAGMPRRIPDYGHQFADFNLIASIGAFVFGLSQLIFFFIILRNVWTQKDPVIKEKKCWDGANGLEWTVPSPAPHHTFMVPPVLTHD